MSKKIHFNLKKDEGGLVKINLSQGLARLIIPYNDQVHHEKSSFKEWNEGLRKRKIIK
ncbi:unnamed protein product [marine sediment metagenome]|uniref:Uncharacterized protein n=1 Tax=marine sediment metagenome TaxID=412755 RepID=X1GL38_9ZZZZ